jgi:hypothetical protein
MFVLRGTEAEVHIRYLLISTNIFLPGASCQQWLYLSLQRFDCPDYPIGRIVEETRRSRQELCC